MPELTNDELLSAYLDGELTAEEQARAERLIAADEQVRALFDELRGMRSCLQGLPSQKLPDDFSARVLRAAEQQILKAPASPSMGQTNVLPVQSPLTLPERFRRPLAYVALVLAASLLIAIFNPDTPSLDGTRKEVAVAPLAAPVETSGQIGDVAPPSETPAMSAAPESVRALGVDANPTSDRIELDDKQISDLTVAKKGSGQAGAGGGVAMDSQAVSAADNGLMVVTCEITPTAAREDSFRQLLVRNQISLEEGAVTQAGQTPATAATSLARREAQLQREDAKSGFELIYVEATQAQLEATLAEMAAQPKQFLSVDVGPTQTSLTQNRWQEQYSRGRGGVAQQRYVVPALPPQQVASGAAAASTSAPTEVTSPPVPAKPAALTAKAPASPPAAADAVQSYEGKATGRARAYAMPAEGLNVQRNVPEAKLEQQPAIAAGQKEKLNRAGDGVPLPAIAEKAQAAKQGYFAQEPGTLRALFVLRVADDPLPADKK